MSKRRKRKRAAPVAHPSDPSRQRRSLALGVLPPILLGLIAFAVYLPTLGSDLVYDGRTEILKEGFVTSLANLPTLFSLKIFSSHVILADRPGQMLYLMLNAALWETKPWGYHLASNLLHAANACLLFALMRRLVAEELPGVWARNEVRVTVLMALATLLFAVHPLTVEAVSEINYSSDLLVTFFTLVALLSATTFGPGRLVVGVLGVACCFASVSCKESGLATAALLALYWLLFRRSQPRGPWLAFLGASLAVAAAFLAARFLATEPAAVAPRYLGGSFIGMLAIQPRLWVFMLGKLVWPVGLSADYTVENAAGIGLPLALAVLSALVLGQGWLARRSRIGALGVGMFWLGLATVSNFMPLYRIEADRFYYLPLAGLALQGVTVAMRWVERPAAFWITLAPGAVALVPLAWLNLARQPIFAGELPLWSDTVRMSPFSPTAHSNYGVALDDAGRLEEARHELETSIRLDPCVGVVHNTLGVVLRQQGDMEGATRQYQQAIALDPLLAEAHYNLGNVLLRQGQTLTAALEYQKALNINPSLPEAHENLATVWRHLGQFDAAIAEYQKALELKPGDEGITSNLQRALVAKSQSTGAPRIVPGVVGVSQIPRP